MAMNPQNVLSSLRMMSDQQLQQYAAMHKNDPFIFPLAFQESQTRKQMRAESQAMQPPQPKVADQALAQMTPQPRQLLPEDVGIGALPADNLKGMATGGIVAFDDGGEVPRYNKGGTLFDTAFDRTLRYEGGYTEDTGGPTMYGISQRANPDIDVKSLTPDKAKKIYKERYWDAISGDKLASISPALAQVAFDTAVNQGVDKAKQFVEQSGGDPKKILELRGQHYASLVKNDPDKYGKYQAGWNNRLADLATSVIPSAQAGTMPAAAPEDKAALIPGQRFAAPAASTKPTGFMSPEWFQEKAESLGLLRDTGRQVYNTMMAPTPLLPATTLTKTSPGLLATLGEKIYNRFVPAAGLSPESIAALRAESELARKITPEAQLLLTGPQAKLPGTTIPVTQAGEGITSLVQPARMVPPGPEATRLEQMAAAANARKAAQAAQGAETGTTATKAASLAQDVAAGESAAEKIQKASLLREAEEAAQLTSAAQRAQAAKTGAALTSAAATAAGSMGAGSPFGGIDLGATDASLGAVGITDMLSKDDKTELKDLGKETAKDAGIKTKGWTGDDFIAMGLGILSGQSPNALTNIGEGGLKGLAMRQARIKEEADTAYKEALARHYGVDPFVQRLQALKDPENVKMFKTMKDLEREPMTREAVFKQFMSSPLALGVDPKDLPAAFQKYVQSYESVLGPIGGLPKGVTVTPRSP